MSYNHLNTFERTRIEVLSKMGYSTRQIAQQLNRHHSTIARELKRNTQETYQAENKKSFLLSPLPSRQIQYP